MKSVKTGHCLILAGSDGQAPKLLVAAVVQRMPEAIALVTATTRPPREGEIDGVHHRFMTRRAFLDAAACEEFVEFREINGYLYGTPAKALAAQRMQYDWTLVVTDQLGAINLRQRVRGARAVFVTVGDELSRSPELAVGFDRVIPYLPGRNDGALGELYRYMSACYRG